MLLFRAWCSVSCHQKAVNDQPSDTDDFKDPKSRRLKQQHENAVNVLERPKRYVQLLWYPQGFTRGDGSLRYIAGSHLEDPREADSCELT